MVHIYPHGFEGSINLLPIGSVAPSPDLVQVHCQPKEAHPAAQWGDWCRSLEDQKARSFLTHACLCRSLPGMSELRVDLLGTFLLRSQTAIKALDCMLCSGRPWSMVLVVYGFPTKVGPFFLILLAWCKGNLMRLSTSPACQCNALSSADMACSSSESGQLSPPRICKILQYGCKLVAHHGT